MKKVSYRMISGANAKVNHGAQTSILFLFGFHLFAYLGINLIVNNNHSCSPAEMKTFENTFHGCVR